MNLLGYIKKYGQYDFRQKPFNTVDATICITLAYLNFELYLKESDSIIIKDIPDDLIVPLCAGEFTTIQNRKLVRLLRISKRFQNGVVRYVRSVRDKETTTQFFALTLFLPHVDPIICFRGTDLTLIGWKEDLMMILNDAVLAHIEARDYVNDIYHKINSHFLIGGHSKGGNLALYSSANCDINAQNDIINIYNLDGPGFRNALFFTSEKFLRIKSRLIQLFPIDDIVGTLFNNPVGRYIIKAKHFGVFQHNPYNWIIARDGSFKYINKMTDRVKARIMAFEIWLSTLTYDDCVFIIDIFITYFGGTDANLIDFFKRIFSSIKRIYKLHTAYSKQTRKRAHKILRNSYRAYDYAKRYYRQISKDNIN